MPQESKLDLARQARFTYLQVIEEGLAALVTACVDGSKVLASECVDSKAHQQNRDLVIELTRHQTTLLNKLHASIDAAQKSLKAGNAVAEVKPKHLDIHHAFTLVEDSAIEWDMAAVRLAQAIADTSGWQYRDLCSRLTAIHSAQTAVTFSAIKDTDVVAPPALARLVIDAWVDASLDLDQWKLMQALLHDEIGQLAEKAHHEANRELLDSGIRPEIDLRPFIRRARNDAVVALPNQLVQQAALGSSFMAANPIPVGTMGESYVLRQLAQLIALQVPGFAMPLVSQSAALSINSTLVQKIDESQRLVRQQSAEIVTKPVNTENAHELAADLQKNKAALKQATPNPAEKATIEVVALLFQSLLTQDALPPQLRVWFARLQMPVLRVAIREPEFFAEENHPARALIDRMGSCAMGFTGDTAAFEDDALHIEVKRIVQVIEAYPDTGRAVFQTVLTEFESFLKTYFKDANEASRKGVSLAEQLEQREALAVQYTIELRKMLHNLPISDAIRSFLFKVWADVMAQSALQSGVGSDAMHDVQNLAKDLIWLASAKSSREERSQVLQRLPPLLKALRAGMSSIGLNKAKQESHIQMLNTAFIQAFSSKTEGIPPEQFQVITQQLQALDELLPTMPDVVFDADMLRDLSGYEEQDLDVVAHGGATTPSQEMLDRAAALRLGTWYVLDYRNAKEPMQLVWQGLNRHLTLFASANGRGVLFQVHRLAAFLQAGLMVPREAESLTMKATRQAIEKISADPERLLD